MSRTLFVLFAGFVAFAAACGGKASSGTPTSTPAIPVFTATPAPAAQTCGSVRRYAAGDSGGSIRSGNLERTYLLHVPPSYDGITPMPLVVVYHGVALNAEFMAGYTRFPAEADTEGFVAVFPNATGSPSVWNDTDLSAGTVDDVAFTRDLLAKLGTDLCIDSERIFVAGYSNGGGMAQRVACNSPKQIAAVALVEATYQQCNGTQPLIAFHGTLDPEVPFDGGDNPPEKGGGVFPPVRRSVSEWARNLGCDGLGTISRPANSVELTTYRRCAHADGEVLLYALIGGGHTWAGAAIDLPANVTGATNHDINATATIWQFFADHPLNH